jgi:acetyl esterase/lipase
MEENNQTTCEKAVQRDREAQKLFKETKTLGEKIPLLPKSKLTCLFYPGTKALVLDIHGGGFCFKNVLDNDVYCDYLAKAFGVAVLNLDFTLSYQKEYPTQLNEMVAELTSFLQKRPLYQDFPLIVVGHSSGANLAAALTILLGKRVKALLLNYPFLDLARDPSTRPLIPETFPDFLINDWIKLYCPNNELLTNPLVSPIYLEDFSSFPPTYITVAEHCRLKEDGFAFYDHLQKHGIPSFLQVVEERHGFIERHMRNVYLTPEDPAVINAKAVTDQSFAWLFSKGL